MHSPSAKRSISVLHNDIFLMLDFRDGTLLDHDITYTFENDRAHCKSHDERSKLIAAV